MGLTAKIKAASAIRHKQRLHKLASSGSARTLFKTCGVNYTGLKCLPGGQSKVERQKKGHTWKKKPRNKWQSFTQADHMLAKTRLIPLHKL